ncbi:uncharacterized protein Z518_01136 [Rhinocladiella mackenziei CBS 650.93]|uniref:Carbonic anhydrase n=1 Tax=Rhinocladiella mackenziei CBS 650.93 TaxID=1442369 RepID=A0A0D2JKT1_9EURO|nr:uncharacterized protein Z518_01136 [Rhinocladiella mackenziei CBS 650.93]KIX10055.1 hypothetical protein Z518_01136 [Rhinocladiella mackenziei CBS 650.93]
MAMMKNNSKAHGPHLLVISCLDSRSNPYNVLGLKPYECIVIRNVAGRFATATGDIAALDTLFHVSQLVLLQHSNCGASHVTKEQVIDSTQVKRPEFGVGNPAEPSALEARLPMVENNHQALKEDLRAVKQCGFLRQDLIDSVVGLYLDVDSGLVTRVYPDSDVDE